jgi:hypothetical protein
MFPGLVTHLQWRLSGLLLLLQRLLCMLHLLLRGRLPGLLLLLQRMLFRLLLILMLQLWLRHSLPRLPRLLSMVLLLEKLLFRLLLILMLQLLLRRSFLGLLRLLSMLLRRSFADLLLLLSLPLMILSCSTSIWCCTPATYCGLRVGMSHHGWYKDPILWPLDPLNKSLS